MLDFVSKSIGKLFGSKADKDLKELSPIVDQVNEAHATIQHLSNDELRNKTFEFKQRIADYINDVDAELQQLTDEAEANPEMNATEKEAMYLKVDALKKERNKKIEEVLLEIQPEAFAVVKETAKRFSENTEIAVATIENDKNLVMKRDGVRIDGDKTIFSNTWTAAGELLPGTWFITMCS